MINYQNYMNKNNLKIKIFLFIWLLLWLDLISKYFFYDIKLLENMFFITPVLNKWISWWIDMNKYIILSVTIFSFIFFLFLYHKRYISKYELLFIFSWTLWNFFDRIFFWWVRDFIDLNFFPVFNFADVYISVAVFLMIYHNFIVEKW